MTRGVRSISVLMPTYQGAALLDRVLGSLAEQRVPVPWDFLAVDSGSTDGTLAIFERRAATFPVPLRVHAIDATEFNHGDTRNLLAALSSGELLVFLTDDAVPQGGDWLATLARNFEEPEVGGAYCRNVPRAGVDVLAEALCAHDHSYRAGRRTTRLPGEHVLRHMEPEHLRELYNYCDTASALRRSLWERHPYPRCEGAEDVVMARALLEAGHTVVYEDAARVEHLHAYDAAQTAARARIDGRINAEWLGRVCVATPADARALVERQLQRDRGALLAAGVSGDALRLELERARALRSAFFEALHDGGLTPVRKRAPRMLPEAALDVLQVAGAEDALARDLCERLARRGHRIAALRDPGEAAARLAGAPPQVLHVAGGDARSAPLLEAARSQRVPVVLECSAAPAPALLALADLVVCRDLELYRRLASDRGRHPDSVAPSVAANPAARALEWEYRLRGVACLAAGSAGDAPVRAAGRAQAADQRARLAARLAELAVIPGAPVADSDLPSVAVVVPTLLGQKRLSECLPSLLASRYPEDRVRVVVVDNGAGCAAAVRRRWPRVHVVENGRNQGFTLAANQGARAAEGAEVLAFLNDDVVVEPDWLRELVAPLARRECASTGARMLLFDGSVEYAGGGSNFHGCAIGHPFAALGESEGPADLPRRALFACGGAMAVRADAFAHVGGFDEEYFAYYDDLDLGWRLWSAGHAVHYVPTAVCRHRRSATSRTFPPEQIRRLQIRNALLTCVKNYAEESLERTLPALVALAARRSFVMARCREGPGFAIGADSLQGFLHRVLLRRGLLPRLAKADLLGLNDVLGRFEHWMRRRAQVQALCRRAEPEILRLFVDPFWCVEGERGYVELQRDLCARHGIDRLFE